MFRPVGKTKTNFSFLRIFVRKTLEIRNLSKYFHNLPFILNKTAMAHDNKPTVMKVVNLINKTMVTTNEILP